MQDFCPKDRARWAVIIFQACLTSYFFWWLSERIVLDDLEFALQSIQVHWIAIILGLLIAQQLLVAIRFGLLLNIFGKPIRFGVLLPLSWIANLLGQMSVLGVGSEVYRVYRCARFGMSYQTAVFCALLDRVVGLSVLLILAVISLLLAPNRSIIAQRVMESSLFGDVDSFVMLSIVFLVAAVVGITFTIIKWQFIRAILLEIRFGRRWCNYSVIIGIAMMVHLISGVVVLILCSNVGIQLGVSDALLLASLGLLSSLVPLSLGGWGARELFYYSYFEFLGLDGSIGFGVGLTFGLVVLVVAMMGMGFIFFNKNISGE